MAKLKKKKGHGGQTIALNKIARHNYFIEDTYEAGLALEGWEVKSLRDGRVQMKESHVFIRNGEAWLMGMHVSPLLSASTHINPDPVRKRKLLLHDYEISRLVAAVDQKGYTIVPTALYWKNGKVKIEIGLAKGKQMHDKRASEKERDWDREKLRVLKDR